MAAFAGFGRYFWHPLVSSSLVGRGLKCSDGWPFLRISSAVLVHAKGVRGRSGHR